MVVQSGNYEFVGIHHRLSQTLYVSNIIQPHDCEEPSYGKITSGSMLRQLWMPSIGQSSAAGNRDGLDSGGPNGGPSDSGCDHKDDKKPRDGGNEKSSGSKNKRKGGSIPQEGSSMGSGGPMMVMAVHDIAAKVCTI
jgi:hypothetical protein